MPRIRQSIILLLFIATCLHGYSQTTLYPGELMVLGIVTDMGSCGLPAGSDEISFVCFKDIETGTTIDFTDNGWEFLLPDFWGDSEGTYRMTRTGAAIPKGTVITFQGQPVGPVWTYRTVSPDNQWTFTNLNIPGGPFDMDNGFLGVGGDQVYFMQGGGWNNQGGGTNKAIYDGRLLWATNTNDYWDADGTVNQSNLHPDVTPCFFTQAGNNPWYMNFTEYFGPSDEVDHFKWLERIQDASFWNTFGDCPDWNSFNPNYASGYSIEIEENISITCLVCHECTSPFDDGIQFHLPAGLYNVVYTDGIDTFELFDIENDHIVWLVIMEDVTYTLLSVENANGCTVYSDFGPPAFIDDIGRNAGLFNEIWLCPDWAGSLNLFNFLNGNPDPGGVWSSINWNVPGGIITNLFGPGLYTYFLTHGHPPIPPPFPTFICDPPFDSASVYVHFIDPSLTTYEISCSQNGTPNDIFDDQIEITLNFIADTFGVDYNVFISSGTITPNTGLTGVPTLFTLSPGSAMGPDLFLTVLGNSPFSCAFEFPIEAPGFCSDPCDYDMSANISGDEDVCIKNCPDAPATITVEVEGGTEPYKMDLSLSAPTFPTWNINNVFISSFDEIEICVANVPAPVYNSSTHQLTVPEFLGGTQLLLLLSNVYDKYDCTANLDNDAVYLNIHELPHLDTLELTFCSEFATGVDLTEYEEEINPFFDVVWYDGNPFGAGEQIATPQFVNLTNIAELWAWVKDDYCENAIRVKFTILPSPRIDSIPPVELCSGTAIELQNVTIEDFNNSMAVYSFHINTPLDSSTILDPAYYLPVDSTIVFLLATADICFDTVPININVQDYPDFLLQATPCDLLNSTYSILFTSSADSIHTTIGTVINNPSGQDQVNGIPNNVNVSIELLNSTSLCKDTFLITAPNCNCPFIAQPLAAQPSYDICEGSAIPVLSVNVGPGLVANWYTVPSGGVAFLQNSLTFQPPTPTSANYYVESFDPSNACYSIRTEIPFVVNPLADLQAVADQVLCETETINLNTLTPGVLNGVNGNGSWFNLSNNQPASGVVVPQNGDAWYYLFSTNPGNCKTSDTIQATVNPIPTIDLYEVNCDENTLTYELLFTSDANDVQVSAGNLGQVSGTDSFSLTSIPYDVDIQFVLQNTTTGCNNNFIQAAPDCSCPALLQQNDHEACSGTGNIDLTAFVGFGVTGNWQLVSTPAGANPATLAGNTLQVQNKDGGLYILRFIRSIILDNCVDTAFFDFTLHSSPSADAGIDGTACAPDDIILSGTASGSNVQFNWLTSGSGTISNPNSLNTTYTPSLADITAGSVSFTLTASDQTGFCPSAQETIDITIDGSAYFILDQATQTYCDTSDIIVDFDDLITFGTTGGHWFFPAGVTAPITGNSFFNPTTLAAGNYTVFYTTSNATPPCNNETLGVNLIIENCLCPSVALSVPTDALCSDAATQNLNDFLISTEAGSWSIVSTPAGSKPATLSGTNFITSNSDPGTYRVRFTLSNPVSGCDEFAEIDLDVIETPSIQISSVDCADDLQSWEVIIVTSADVVVNTLGTLTSLGNDRYLIENITLNTNLQITATNGNGLCATSVDVPTPDCECTLSISNLPDDLSLCPGETFVFDAQVSGGKGAVTEFWIVADDSLYQSSLQVGQAGTYQFVSFDELGCKEEHSIDVSIYEEMVPDITMTDITCPGDMDGVIILHGILGGNGPFFLSLNGGSAQPITSFPYMINNLASGNYQIEITDGFSCIIEFNVMIQSASSENVDLGPDQTILVGDSILINPLLTFSPDTFYWTGDIDIIDPELLANWISPEADKTLELFAIDDKGCLYSDDIKIRVLLSSAIYVPTIFSPNGDGINDLLAPLTDPSITSFEFFEIYSRWGELIFSKTNFAPNQVDFGWDGTLREKPANPGVYVYRLKAFNKRGKEYVQYGDITLVK